MKQPYTPIEDFLSKKEAILFRSKVVTYDLSLAIVFGDAGSGKTTFQRTLTQFMSENDLRTISIHPKENEIYTTNETDIVDVISGEEVPVDWLVAQGVRMRAEVITVDDGTIPDNLLLAACKGHMGGATINASTYEEALAKFEEQKNMLMPEEIMEQVFFFHTVRQGNIFSVKMM